MTVSDNDLNWLTSRQAAGRVGISVFTLGRYQQLGWIRPTYTLGGHRRFTVAEVDALAARRRGVRT